MTVLIRDFHPNDTEQFLAVARDLQNFELALYDRMMAVDAIGEWYIDTLLKQCTEEDGSILVAVLESRVIGFATIFTNVQQQGEIDEIPFTYGFISHISVASTARGTGTGKLLMAECERRAREAGCRWLRIPALAKNAQARGIYEHLGFSEHLVTLEKTLV
ncbi:GNAT family N-acetyltransferase [Pseudomonas sp. NPDC088444]|uniref:GNAT family N-acetyltransferase n=1 Tax=Pseudomonas sp. NPDC088444 TaxID=3364456 RepID=UPI00384E3A0D